MTTGSKLTLMSAPQAAIFLAKQINDGRDYVFLLSDMRRGRRKRTIQYFRVGNRPFYLEAELMMFVDEELAKTLPVRKKYAEVDADDYDALADFFGGIGAL